MTLNELYAQTPVELRGNIIVDGNRVYILSEKGKPFVKWFLLPEREGELILIDERKIA